MCIFCVFCYVYNTLSTLVPLNYDKGVPHIIPTCLPRAFLCVSSYLWFHFPQFQLPVVDLGPKILNKTRNRQFISFKLRVILSSVVTPCAVPLCPTRDADHPFVQHLPAVRTAPRQSLGSHLGYHRLSRCHSACSSNTYFT